MSIWLVILIIVVAVLLRAASGTAGAELMDVQQLIAALLGADAAPAGRAGAELRFRVAEANPAACSLWRRRQSDAACA